MIEPGLVPPSAVYGRMQVWCANTSIGGFYNPRCSLYPAYLGFKQLVASLSTLWRTDLDGLSEEKLIDRLDQLLYGARCDELLEDDDRAVFECECDWGKYGSFNFLTNLGEKFDREGKAFIFCPPAQPAKILVQRRGSDTVLPLHASIPAAVDVIDEFLRWFHGASALLANQNPI